jgi:hypothetical protein
LPRDYISLGEIARHTWLLEVRCSRCSRAGRLNVVRLIEQYGPDARLPTADLIGNCPKRDAALYQKCDLFFPQLPEWFLEPRRPGLS